MSCIWLTLSLPQFEDDPEINGMLNDFM